MHNVVAMHCGTDELRSRDEIIIDTLQRIFWNWI